jgi:hypothetical protein
VGAVVWQQDAVGVVADELVVDAFVVGESSWTEGGVEPDDGDVGSAREAGNERYLDGEVSLVWFRE